MDSRVKRYVEDGNAVNLDFGFIPEYVRVIQNIAGANPDVFEWFKAMEDEATPQYGILHNGADGVITELTTAATGIIKFDAKYQGVLVADPAGGDDQFAVPTVYATTDDYSSGFAVRTTTAIGAIVRPIVRNGFVYELKTGSGAGTTEPTTWGTTVGGETTDGGSNVFTCRDEKVFTKGAQGITMGATSQTDSQVSIVIAQKNIHYENAGDAALAGASDFI